MTSYFVLFKAALNYLPNLLTILSSAAPELSDKFLDGVPAVGDAAEVVVALEEVAVYGFGTSYNLQCELYIARKKSILQGK